MVDLVAIGASGVNVYKRALATVSNNIANMGTEGYSRQVTDIRQNTPTAAGKSTIGNGAYFDKVSRQYDEFLEASLQQATSDLESQGATVEFAKRLLDLIGDEKIGATSALTKFFGSAKALSTDAASLALRNAMLRDADELVSRFNGLSEQIDSLGDQAMSALEADIRALNGLSKQIASVNTNLLKKKLEVDQPPQLLDQRDQLLRDLSKFVGIKTQVDNQGLVSISLTQSLNKGLLVDGVQGYELALIQNNVKADGVSFEIKGGAENVALSGVLSGSVAGYTTFIDNTMSNLGQRLNEVVTVLVSEVNTVQTTGLDLRGDEGTILFELEPGIEIDKGASRGDFDVNPVIQDLNSVVNGSYAFTYEKANSSWIPGLGQALNSDVALGIPGVEFRIAGEPLDGDRFIVNIFDDAARGMRLAIDDGIKIAASSLLRVTPGVNNIGALESTVSFKKQPTSSLYLGAGPVTLGSPATEPVGVIQAGQSDIRVQVNPSNSSSISIDVLTKDGRHLIGEADTAGLTNVVSQSDFFDPNATYSDAYLNKSGSASNSYKHFEVGYGAFGQTNLVTQLSPFVGDVVTAPSTTDFSGGYLDFSVGLFNPDSRVSLTKDAAINTSSGAISIVGNAIYRGTGLASERLADIVYPQGPSSPNFDSLRVNFSNAVSGVDVSVLNFLATNLAISNGRDLTTSPYPVISRVSIEAVTESGAAQFQHVAEFDSDQLIRQGLVETSSLYRSELIGGDIPLFSGDGTVVVEANKLAINGTNLGELTVGASGIENYGRLSAVDIKSWVDAAGAANVNVSVSNEILIPTSSVSLTGSGLNINNVDITSLGTGTTTIFSDINDVVQSVNSQTALTGVGAAVGRNGEIRLSNTNGANIKIGSSVGPVASNLLGVSNGTFTGSYRIVQESQSNADLALKILSSGSAVDLNSVGLDTVVQIRGEIDEDLAVFIRGSGDSQVSTTQVSNGKTFVSGLRNRVFDIEFVSDTRYQITDRATSTVVADRTYAGEKLIEYQGIEIALESAATEGDLLTLDGNNTGPGQEFDAHGNNSNLMRILELESAGVVSGQSLTQAYLDLVGDVGNEATQAEISYEALGVLEEQAIEARDRVSGVSLDREAADLIRFQQAYQASAQVIQIATRIFDDILQIR